MRIAICLVSLMTVALSSCSGKKEPQGHFGPDGPNMEEANGKKASEKKSSDNMKN